MKDLRYPYYRVSNLLYLIFLNSAQLKKFLMGEKRTITVPGGKRKIKYDPLQRIGVGITRLGTSEAVAIGAYAFALQKLDAK